MTLNEVAPPGWGHTKAEKEKTKPNKPKSKIGGSSAAFKRALDDGRFKGLPGDKTKKEKTASMFKLMWAMKKKGAKPHYKPGTDKKYEKYQEESEMPNVDKKDRGAIKKRFKGLFKKDIKGTVSGVNENIEVTGGFEFQDYDPNMKFREYEFIDIIKPEPLKGTVSEATGCSDDYENLKKKIGSKKKHDKPAITFKEFKDINTYT